MKKILLFTILFILIIASPTDVFAKKKLPGVTTKQSAGSTKGVSTSVKFTSGKHGIVATFSNLDIASSVSYSLTYSSRGIQEGAGGSLTDLSGTQTRELLFGTCSSGVCRYHKNPKNAHFTVTTALQNGKKVSKVFKLKI